MEGLSFQTLITQKLLYLEASNFACLFKNKFCRLNISMNIWDTLILFQYIVKDKQKQTKQLNRLNMMSKKLAKISTKFSAFEAEWKAEESSELVVSPASLLMLIFDSKKLGSTDAILCPTICWAQERVVHGCPTICWAQERVVHGCPTICWAQERVVHGCPTICRTQGLLG